ncbi:hypothetical protein Syun_007136 [Stephania yunnanensis]|uniref:Uncharacterized protein n=1 Tax=Stephania yunnanensis TaxID=152371 RepID=A0AAP0ESR5_9MAGN
MQLCLPDYRIICFISSCSPPACHVAAIHCPNMSTVRHPSHFSCCPMSIGKCTVLSPTSLVESCESSLPPLAMCQHSTGPAHS